MTVCAGLLEGRVKVVDRGLDEPCWIWTGGQRNGKALVRLAGEYVYVHRVLWQAHYGEKIDRTISLMLQCGETLCVNIAHYRKSRRLLGLPPREAVTPEKNFAWSLRRYGLTVEDYERLLAEQDGTCAVCHRCDSGDRLKRRLHIDHDHATGYVRGLLCSRCNNAIGQAEEDVQRLRDLASYLERSSPSL